MMEIGRYATLNELAAAEKINSSYVSRLLRLTLLAPGLVEAFLGGRQPVGMTLPALMDGVERERQKIRAHVGVLRVNIKWRQRRHLGVAETCVA